MKAVRYDTLEGLLRLVGVADPTPPIDSVLVKVGATGLFRHGGIADAMAHAGLECARTERLAVTARSPFLGSYIRSHPEHQSQMEPGT